MKYLIVQGTSVLMTATEEIDAIDYSKNLSKTTDAQIRIYKSVYNVNNEAGVVSLVEANNSSVDGIIETLLDIDGITPYELRGKNKSRKKEYVIVRQWIMFILHIIGGYSSSVSGRKFGKDHATCLHSVKKIRNAYQFDKSFRRRYSEVISMCKEKRANCFDET